MLHYRCCVGCKHYKACRVHRMEDECRKWRVCHWLAKLLRRLEDSLY